MFFPTCHFINFHTPSFLVLPPPPPSSSTTSSRSQWALPDLNRELQIYVVSQTNHSFVRSFIRPFIFHPIIQPVTQPLCFFNRMVGSFYLHVSFCFIHSSQSFFHSFTCFIPVIPCFPFCSHSNPLIHSVQSVLSSFAVLFLFISLCSLRSFTSFCSFLSCPVLSCRFHSNALHSIPFPPSQLVIDPPIRSVFHSIQVLSVFQSSSHSFNHLLIHSFVLHLQMYRAIQSRSWSVIQSFNQSASLFNHSPFSHSGSQSFNQSINQPII